MGIEDRMVNGVPTCRVCGQFSSAQIHTACILVELQQEIGAAPRAETEACQCGHLPGEHHGYPSNTYCKVTDCVCVQWAGSVEQSPLERLRAENAALRAACEQALINFRRLRDTKPVEWDALVDAELASLWGELRHLLAATAPAAPGGKP